VHRTYTTYSVRVATPVLVEPQPLQGGIASRCKRRSKILCASAGTMRSVATVSSLDALELDYITSLRGAMRSRGVAALAQSRHLAVGGVRTQAVVNAARPVGARHAMTQREVRRCARIDSRLTLMRPAGARMRRISGTDSQRRSQMVTGTSAVRSSRRDSMVTAPEP
jgi:hypothetical protein